ncbi:MAG: hypothetical protein QF371_07715, partial [Flavobacteriales bacterium]|nr:hypothetical protein [Flavobacteriales bacterium]
DIEATDPEYWNFYADLKERSGLYEEAVDAMDKACTLHPENMHYWVSKAQLIFHHIDRELGIETLFEAIKIAPDSPELHYREAAYMLAAGQRVEALNFLQNGLELDYSKHLLLFEEFPEAINIPRVMDLIEIYGQ